MEGSLVPGKGLEIELAKVDSLRLAQTRQGVRQSWPRGPCRQVREHGWLVPSSKQLFTEHIVCAGDQERRSGMLAVRDPVSAIRSRREWGGRLKGRDHPVGGAGGWAPEASCAAHLP